MRRFVGSAESPLPPSKLGGEQKTCDGSWVVQNHRFHLSFAPAFQPDREYVEAVNKRWTGIKEPHFRRCAL